MKQNNMNLSAHISRKILVVAIVALFSIMASFVASACDPYKITVGGGTADSSITWQLADSLGNIVASGFAPQTVITCLDSGCYTMTMMDSVGDGWNGAGFSLINFFTNANVGSGTLLGGASGTIDIGLNWNCYQAACSGFYTLDVTAGNFPAEVSWSFVDSANLITNGFAPANQPLCLDSGCYSIIMFDNLGNGWNGAVWTLTDSLGNIVAGPDSLIAGSIASVSIPIGGATCVPPPPVTSSDCVDAIEVCNNLTFAIDPNGWGNTLELPGSGNFSNPQTNVVPGNAGCLLNGELNSTWMIINVYGTGSLEFTFGGLGTQTGYYDWIMFPYTATTCADILSATIAPVRCNWNASSWGGTGLASSTPAGGSAGNYEPPLNVVGGEQYIICFTNWSSSVNIVPLDFGGTAVISCAPIVLPIEFVNVSATTGDNGILVEWTTTSEDFVDHFTVQGSQDLIEWRDLKELSGGGTDIGLINYEYLDAQPLSGWNYYRIKQTDIDGISEFSSHASALWEKEEANIYPNPNNGNFTLEIGSNVDISAIRVVDAIGRDIPVVITSVNGVQQLSMDRPTSGIYYILIGGGENPALKVIVEKE